MSKLRDIVDEFKMSGWNGDSIEKILGIAHRSSVDAADLTLLIIKELPKGGTFLHAILNFVSLDAWPALIKCAIDECSRNRKNEAAESVIHYAALQCVHALHPHLKILFDLLPDETRLWRDAGEDAANDLFSILRTSTVSAKQRRKAWMCLLETRKQDTIRHAVKLVSLVDLNLQLREFGLKESLDVQAYLHDVGFEQDHGDLLRKLYSDRVFHLCFPDGYFTDARPFWIRRENHPTWLASSEVGGQISFGGAGAAICGRCGHPTHRLVRFSSQMNPSGVTGIEALSIETCLSCMGWETSPMFYRHEKGGLPGCLSISGPPPQFPAVNLKATQVQLVDQGSRWNWQDWGASNSRENLNRVGGHPTWIQSAEYPICPDCKSTMMFLMQLDSDLPTEDGGSWLWGSGGIAYVFWCDACKISGLLWQCT